MELPKWDKKNPYVPIDRNGNWMQYARGVVDDPDSTWYGYKAAKLEYIKPFEANIRILDYYTGRSARGLNLQNEDTGVKYTMFMSDFIDFIRHGNVKDGIMVGTWTVVKKGANFGIRSVTT